MFLLLFGHSQYLQVDETRRQLICARKAGLSQIMCEGHVSFLFLQLGYEIIV